MRALTIGAIAKKLNIPIHRVGYVVKTRNIRPTQIAGNIRIFDIPAFEKIRTELFLIDARASTRGGHAN